MKLVNYLNIIIIISVFCQSCFNLAIRSSDILDDQIKIKLVKNTNKNIIFIPMHHIGKKTFYAAVDATIDSLIQSGYVLYFESVTTDSSYTNTHLDSMMRKIRKIINLDFVQMKENGGYLDTINNTILGHKTNLVKKFHLVNQSFKHYYSMKNNRIRNIDVTINENTRAYEAKFGEILLERIDMETPFKNKYKSKNDKFKKDYFLLGYRNELIANTVIKDTATKIVLMYGAYHFDGILDNLKAYDKTYQEVDKF